MAEESLTKELGLPLILKSDIVLREKINATFQKIDAVVLPKTHADTKAHFDMWQPNKDYKKQDVVRSSTCPSWGFFMCKTPGTSGTTEPSGYGEGDIVADGTCTWVLKLFGGATVIKHQDLQGRNLSDQHTIAAITDLQSVLDSKETPQNKGKAGGYPELNNSGYIPMSQLPPNVKEMRVLNTIVDRDAITGSLLYDGLQVHVLNATGDPTVKSGWAEYMYDAANSVWIKRAEKESMDIVLNWMNLQNIPAVLTALSDKNGALQYKGNPVYEDIRNVVFVGGDNELMYPWNGTIQNIAVVCSEPQATALQFNIEVQAKADYAAKADKWTLVGGSILTFPANTAYQEFTGLTQNNSIKTGDVIRASTAGDDTGIVFHVTIKNN